MAPEFRRLLFVDDEPSALAVLPQIFARAGFAVSTATSLKEALELIFLQGFEVLVTDLHLDPGGTGFKLVRAMREVNPHCVNIVITGYPEFTSAVEGIREGIDDLFAEPVDPDAILRSVEIRLHQRRPKGRILSVSYDEALLRTRHMLLQTQGFQVISTRGFTESLPHCKRGGFDLFILGHSIPVRDKMELIHTFKAVCEAPIISLSRLIGEKKLDGADYHIEPDPEQLLELVADIIDRAKSRRRA